MNKYCMKNKVLLLLLIVLLTACRPTAVHHCAAPVFGTYYTVTYCGDEDAGLQASLDSLFTAFSSEFSLFDSSSVVCRLNRGEDVVLSKDFERLLQLSMQISRNTDGAFDVTVAPLVKLWGFGPDSLREVTPQMVDSVLENVGYKKIGVEYGHLIKRNANIQLDFGAIAKGLAVDKAVALMRQRGHADFLVDIGGEVRTCGSKYGKPWRIGVQVPTADSDGEIASNYDFPLTDKAIATSGNYRNYHEKDGERFSHIINPTTGYSERSDLLSVSVIADDCTTADAYATALMVMGREKSLQWLQAHPELAAYLIYYEDGGFKVARTPNFP